MESLTALSSFLERGGPWAFLALFASVVVVLDRRCERLDGTIRDLQAQRVADAREHSNFAVDQARHGTEVTMSVTAAMQSVQRTLDARRRA